MADIEGKSSSVIRKILIYDSLDDDEKMTFAIFIACMMTRVPNFRRNIESAAGEIIKRQNLFLASDKEYFKKWIREFEKGTGNTIGMPIEELHQFVLNGEYIVTVDKQLSLTAIDHIEPLSKVFFHMKWTFIKATNDFPFLTGDNPLFYSDPTHDPRSFWGIGLLNDNIEVTFPLSKDLAALGSWKGREQYNQANNNMVKYINKRTASASLRFVFSSKKSETLRKFIIKFKGSSPKIVVR